VRIGFKGRKTFRSAELAESSRMLHNPGCGWYHVYTFTLKLFGEYGSVEEEVWLDEACRAERLALVLIDIGAFRSSRLSEAALCRIRQILTFFQREGKQMILRFAYDTEGHGMLREPYALSMVKTHMEQAGSVIREFAEEILVLQGIFVGNWGEMHGSKFLDEASMRALADAWFHAAEGRCFLAVRTPAQWRRIICGGEFKGEIREKLCLFNDGIFGSPTDLGTYGTKRREESGEKDQWCREDELDWQEKHMPFVPVGGEVLPGIDISCMQAAEEMARLHLCYLNSIYHSEALERWRRERVRSHDCFDKVSGFDYIGCHLGYRFVVRSVAEKRNHTLLIQVENCGFANLLEEAECFLEIEGNDKKSTLLRLDTDPRKWMSGEKTFVPAALPFLCKGGSRAVYLCLRRKRDGRAIEFANQGDGMRVLLGVEQYGEDICHNSDV